MKFKFQNFQNKILRKNCQKLFGFFFFFGFLGAMLVMLVHADDTPPAARASKTNLHALY